MNSENTYQRDLKTELLVKSAVLEASCYMPLPAGQSKHVYPNLSKSTAVMSSLEAGFLDQTKESRMYSLSKFKHKPAVPQ